MSIQRMENRWLILESKPRELTLPDRRLVLYAKGFSQTDSVTFQAEKAVYHEATGWLHGWAVLDSFPVEPAWRDALQKAVNMEGSRASNAVESLIHLLFWQVLVNPCEPWLMKYFPREAAFYRAQTMLPMERRVVRLGEVMQKVVNGEEPFVEGGEIVWRNTEGEARAEHDRLYAEWIDSRERAEEDVTYWDYGVRKLAGAKKGTP